MAVGIVSDLPLRNDAVGERVEARNVEGVYEEVVIVLAQ